MVDNLHSITRFVYNVVFFKNTKHKASIARKKKHNINRFFSCFVIRFWNNNHRQNYKYFTILLFSWLPTQPKSNSIRAVKVAWDDWTPTRPGLMVGGDMLVWSGIWGQSREGDVFAFSEIWGDSREGDMFVWFDIWGDSREGDMLVWSDIWGDRREGDMFVWSGIWGKSREGDMLV